MVFTKLVNAVVHSCNANVQIKRLSIRRLQNVIDEEMGSLLEQHLPSIRLESLALQICNEIWEYSDADNQTAVALHEFFSKSLIKYFMLPTKDHLQHLKLYSKDLWWGYYPLCDFRHVHFPKLRSLHLGNFTFAFDWQLEWILSHGDTLEELVLDDCPIVHGGEVSGLPFYERPYEVPHKARKFTDQYRVEVEQWTHDARWHHYFRRLKGGLPKLKHFGIGHGLWDHDLMFDTSSELGVEVKEERYCVFDSGTLPNPFIEARKAGWRGQKYDCCWAIYDNEPAPLIPDCDGEDQAALDELMAAVRQRAKA